MHIVQCVRNIAHVRHVLASLMPALIGTSTTVIVVVYVCSCMWALYAANEYYDYVVKGACCSFKVNMDRAKSLL